MNARVAFMPCNCMKTYVKDILENVLERIDL
jgi:hypothetical protein